VFCKDNIWIEAASNSMIKKTQPGRERPPSRPGRENPRTLAPITSGRHRPPCNGPAGGWCAGRNPGAGGAQRGDFFNQARNSPSRGIEPRTWRCYSEALTITLEALSPNSMIKQHICREALIGIKALMTTTVEKLSLNLTSVM
jgi:hypothetical protein